MANFTETKALTFDLFGTILDLGGSLTPFIGESLDAHAAADVSADEFWEQWRYRQRIEQYQDTIMMLGHSGYLETVRRALHYTLRRNSIDTSVDIVKEFMRGLAAAVTLSRSFGCTLAASISVSIGRFYPTETRRF